MRVHRHDKPAPIPREWTLNTEKSAVPPKVCADNKHEFHLVKAMGANAKNAWTQVTKLLKKFSFTCSFSSIVNQEHFKK